jgi:stage II sporulation protein D
MTQESLQFSGAESPSQMRTIEPVIHVGIIDEEPVIEGSLNDEYETGKPDFSSGKFFAKAASDTIVLFDERGREIRRSPEMLFKAPGDSCFTLFGVTIGNRFHWERKEDQIFQHDLLLKLRGNGTLAAINAIPLEDYLKSVISSEMSGNAAHEFLMAHAIMSRSWLLAALERKHRPDKSLFDQSKGSEHANELVRWYEQEDHDLYDVCADDHCQRYQGITKIVSSRAGDAVLQTRGQVLTYGDQICDARFSKACGGLTEVFSTAWEPRHIPYLTSVSDAPTAWNPIQTEEDAVRWITSEPAAYCNTEDNDILNSILPGFDRETEAFFRWKVEYDRKELEEIIHEKSGLDFGKLREIRPLSRGPSGRIYRLGIVGSKKSMVVGKELEIRRWLSRSHLYSSAFVVNTGYNAQNEAERFILHGAGWGHGVGLCQIGAAVMAHKGFTAGEILAHYFPATQLRKIY